MIIGKIARAVLKIIMPDILEHMMKVFKSDKVLAYMELPNDADRGVEAVRKGVETAKQDMNMVKDELKTIHSLIGELEEAKDIMKKLKNKSAFKKLFK